MTRFGVSEVKEGFGFGPHGHGSAQYKLHDPLKKIKNMAIVICY